MNKSVKPLNADDFLIERPAAFDTSNVASTTLVKFNASQNTFYTADVLSQSLYIWDSNLKMVTKRKLLRLLIGF